MILNMHVNHVDRIVTHVLQDYKLIFQHHYISPVPNASQVDLSLMEIAISIPYLIAIHS